MNRNYRAQGRSTAHILQLFNRKAEKSEVEEEETSNTEESTSRSTLSPKNVIDDDNLNNDL